MFGTDGIRGVGNRDLTPELALDLGRALVALLREEGESRPSILIGRDPRWSGEMLDAALTAGITSAGGDAVTIGVLPTPAVAYLTAAGGARAGAMISASHNPVQDNGIKFFGPEGFKLTDDEEDRLEELMRSGDIPRPTGTNVGRRLRDPAAVARYVEHLVVAADVGLSGIKLVVDGANGAAAGVAPQVYRQLGAEVVTINCSPDGSNINEHAGSTYPDVIRDAVIEHAADLGVSHDGDADRLIAATHEGAEVDGDVILAILTRDRKNHGTLKNNAVATTVMTNLGFKQAMQRLDIDVVETKVGDRYVLEAMKQHDLVIGGEQSGHVIQLDKATTGDGILSAVSLLSVVRATGVSLRELATVMERLPQVLVNVEVTEKDRLADAGGVWDAVASEEEKLAGSGRVLVRPSGTEPLVRVMVEAEDEQTAESTAERIAEVVRETLGAA